MPALSERKHADADKDLLHTIPVRSRVRALQDGAKMIQTDTIEYYDPEADAWQLVTDFNLPAPCYGAAMCVT